MNYVGIVRKQIGFGKTATWQRDFRETKHHYIDNYGTKFSKKTGHSLAGWKCKGVFIGEVLDLATLSESC